MHLKEKNAPRGDICLMKPQETPATTTTTKSVFTNNNNNTCYNNNNNNNKHHDQKVVINNNNNNNKDKNKQREEEEEDTCLYTQHDNPLLIIETVSGVRNPVDTDFTTTKSSSSSSSSSSSTTTTTTSSSSSTSSPSSSSLPERDGMTTSPAASLLDLSENVSLSSDRLHHPSISSGGLHQLRRLTSSSNGSLSSIDNDESDLDSCSSLEVDIPRGDPRDFINTKDKDYKSQLDFEVLGYHSRRPSSLSCGYQDCEGWSADSASFTYVDLHCNDLSPDHNLCNNNVNELTECGAFIKSFYDKPKIQLQSDGHLCNKSGDDNGNVGPVGSSADPEETCNAHTSTPESLEFTSDDENPSDIEQKMAETKVKMNDAILSNGKEELSLHGRKLKHYMKHKEMKETCGAAGSLKQHHHHNLSPMKQPNSLKLSDAPDGDNRYTQAPESPIVDAYEKECLDVPEKMVRELENQAKESVVGEEKKEEREEEEEEEQGGAGDDFIPCKKEKMEINEHHKKCRSGDQEDKDVPTPPEVPTSKKADTDASKENVFPVASSVERSRVSRVTFGSVEEAGVVRRDSPQRRRDRAALRKSVPQAASCSASSRDRAKLGSPDGGEFDVYTMETAMPKIDWDAIEAHLKATKEEERRRRNDREEIRRKLAMGIDDDQVMERPHRKPSLHSRLQSGMNLQICFMNETASDCESQCSDTESTQDRDVDTDHITSANSKTSTPLALRTRTSHSEPDIRNKEVDFFARQAQLQAEARMALAQAKEMARMQMEIEKQSKKKSPIADIVRASFNKIGVPFPDSKRRISRQILTDMNVAQLQVIVNDLHTQIESLNEDLVTFLMERDDLHMEQDSMLVDIEDLTKHIGAKEMSLRGGGESKGSAKGTPVSTPPPRSKSNSLRLKNIVKK
ncbi:uncharacterized protein Schip1 isoform X2 [Procambarus clarkii]|uniref:uncharacterized protein Schip1 isoform X2 n=1 Tax=Procambarus clarkii TaxID=6728 RepID=UPI003741EE69